MLSFASWLVALMLLSVPCHSDDFSYVRVTENHGTCEDNGMARITTKEACTAAAAQLGLPTGSGFASTWSRSNVHGGCLYELDQHDIDFNSNVNNNQVHSDRQVICKSMNAERPYFHLNITFNEMVGTNGGDAFDSHFDAIIEVLSDYLDCDKKAIDATSLSHDGLSVKVGFAISGKSEEEVAHEIDDILHFIKLPVKLIFKGVPVLSVDTVYKSWADAAETSKDIELTTDEPSTTEPMNEFPYFHLNITFNEAAGFNGAEAYESHRDAIQAVISKYLECNKKAINATFITHMDMSAEVKFVISGMSERRVAREIDDSWHFLKLPLTFVANGVPVVWVDTVHASWERGIYDSSSALLTGFMASFILLCTFF